MSLELPAPSRALLSPKSSYVEGDIPNLLRREDVIALLAVHLAGRAAEKRVFGDVSSGAASDLRQATELALFAECRAGLTSDLNLHLPYAIERPDTWPAHVHSSLQNMMDAGGKLAAETVKANEAIR